MHAPSNRPWLARRALRAAGLGLLLAYASGCDWRSAEELPDSPGVLDLTGFSRGLADWRCPQDDRDHLPRLRLDSLAGQPMLVIDARNGEASRWRMKIRWDAETHPVLTWTWKLGKRVDSTAFPRTNSPAAPLAVDVTLASAFGFHKTVRYIWSARRDRGAVWANRDNWHPKVIALRDSHDPVDSVLTESVNVWKDFSELWGFTPRHRALAIILSVQDPTPGTRVTGRFGAVLAHPLAENP